MPSFFTERLIIRPRTVDDIEYCLAMDRDPEVVRFISGPWNDPIKHREFVESRMQESYPSGLGYWTVLSNDKHRKFLGWILLIPIDTKGPEIEIGWRLVRTAWGYGYATEAAKVILKHAFENCGIEKVVADIHPENIGSIRVCEKVGFRRKRQYGMTHLKHIRYSLSLSDILS